MPSLDERLSVELLRLALVELLLLDPLADADEMQREWARLLVEQ